MVLVISFHNSLFLFINWNRVINQTRLSLAATINYVAIAIVSFGSLLYADDFKLGVL